MPSQEFIAQLRVYVIALGLGPAVVDLVDNLIGADDSEGKHAAELESAEEDGEKRGRESMKSEIIDDINSWLERQPNYDMIAPPCEALIAVIDKVEL